MHTFLKRPTTIIISLKCLFGEKEAEKKPALYQHKVTLTCQHDRGFNSSTASPYIGTTAAESTTLAARLCINQHVCVINVSFTLHLSASPDTLLPCKVFSCIICSHLSALGTKRVYSRTMRLCNCFSFINEITCKNEVKVAAWNGSDCSLHRGANHCQL